MEANNLVYNARDIRKKLGMTQTDFWEEIGVTQSGGSRYESGRKMPKPVRELFRIVHVEKVKLIEVNGLDLKIAQILKKEDLELYKKLKASAKRLLGN